VVPPALALTGLLLGRNVFYASDNLSYDVVCNLLLQGIGFGRNLNGPSWSISTEFAAYPLFPVILALAFSRRRAADRAGIRRRPDGDAYPVFPGRGIVLDLSDP
jgi:peptidoglycan/LPS O-acetylase OafA/YrhL